MEGRSEARQRTLKRCYQCNRMEEQVWAAAYEQVWPLIRRVVRRPGTKAAGGLRDQVGPATTMARRA
jgi:hypothetical protein